MTHVRGTGRKKGTKTKEQLQQKADAKTARAEVKSGTSKRKVTTLPTIKAEPQKKSLGQKALGVLTSPKTTVALATTLIPGGLAAKGAGAAAKAGTATVTGTVAGHRLIQTAAGAEKLVGFGVRSATRNFVGKPAIPKNINKLFHAVRPTASRFAVNSKTQGLTTSLLAKKGMSLRAASIVVAGGSTYPFARFELAEATDKIGIAIFTASQAGDNEEVDRLVEVMNEMLDFSVWENIISGIPLLNVAQSVTKNLEAAVISAKSIQETVGTKKDSNTEFAESQEQARQTKLEQRERDSEYFQLIREEKFEEADELLQSELKGGN